VPDEAMAMETGLGGKATLYYASARDVFIIQQPT